MRTRIHSNKGRRATISLTIGDITNRKTEAIVNAANDGLWAGSGVCGKILKEAGKVPFDECKSMPVIGFGQKRCNEGDVVRTSAGKLKYAKHIFHAVGPVYSESDKEKSKDLLSSAYYRTLVQASSSGVYSISFPAISTGVFGFPLEDAAKIAMETVVSYLTEERYNKVKEVEFVLYDSETYIAFRDALYSLRKDSTHRRHWGWLTEAQMKALEPYKAPPVTQWSGNGQYGGNYATSWEKPKDKDYPPIPPANSGKIKRPTYGDDQLSLEDYIKSIGKKK